MFAVDRRKVIDAGFRTQLFHQSERSSRLRNLGKLDGFPLAVHDDVLVLIAEVDSAHLAIVGAASPGRKCTFPPPLCGAGNCTPPSRGAPALLESAGGHPN